jgi:ABC-type branched-subunit amino acid transport system substrate-binding protein
MRRRSLLAAVPSLAMPSIVSADNEEIKIGNIMPYSGPASALSQVGKAQAAYIKMLNDNGGIAGRLLNFITLDDGYSPPKAVEHARRLVEQERVDLMFSPLGTPGISATIKYFNNRKVPHLFAVSGVSRFSDPLAFPYTVASLVNYQIEARIYAKLIVKERAGSRIALLYQNDDLGKDYLIGLRSFFKERYEQVVIAASYELTDPTVDSQVINLKASDADVLLFAGTPKFASQAIRKAHDLGWKAMIVLNLPSSSLAATIQPAGIDRSVGVITGSIGKDPDDPRLASDPAVATYRAFLAKHLPGANPSDTNIVFGYNLAMALEHVLTQCGKDLGGENIMRQALSIRKLAVPMLPAGVVYDTSPSNHSMLTQMALQRWTGKTFEPLGQVISDSEE